MLFGLELLVHGASASGNGMAPKIHRKAIKNLNKIIHFNSLFAWVYGPVKDFKDNEWSRKTQSII